MRVASATRVADALRQPRRREPAAWVALAALAAFLLTQYGYALGVAFINDDYIFLDKTRAASFLSLWAPRDLLFHYYRPWSRELHYWVLQRLFGPRELPFHVVSSALWLAVMVLYHSVARRLLTLPAAAGATAAVAVLSAWTVPIVWPAGAQEGWMLLWALLFLRAVMDGRDNRAGLALALALLSKETAVVLPAIGLAYLRIIEGLPWRTAVRRTAPSWALTLLWAVLHPLIGRQLWDLQAPVGEPGVHPSLATLVARTLAALFNLYPLPAPEFGWGHALLQGLPAAVLMAGFVGWAELAHRSDQPAGGPSSGQRPQRNGSSPAFGLCWAALAWLPLAMPTIAWRSHYILLGAFGAWLVFAHWLSRSRGATLGVVVLLALLRPAVGDTVSHDWSTEWYRRRAAAFIDHMRADLRAQRPSFPSHTRVFFVGVPSDVGFLTGDGPALRVWYAEPTLRGALYSAYRPRGPAEPRGPDFFFRYDSTQGWVEVVRGREDASQARQRDPRWSLDHQMLAETLARADDWRAAATEYEKLAGADSLQVGFAYNAAVCHETLGDSSRAAVWYTRAAALPGADAETRAEARRFARYLPKAEKR